MGKCEAGGYIPYFKKTVCDGCLHKDVCGNSDYLTENSCADKIECTIAHLRDLLAAEQDVRLPGCRQSGGQADARKDALTPAGREEQWVSVRR